MGLGIEPLDAGVELDKESRFFGRGLVLGIRAFPRVEMVLAFAEDEEPISGVFGIIGGCAQACISTRLAFREILCD